MQYNTLYLNPVMYESNLIFLKTMYYKKKCKCYKFPRYRVPIAVHEISLNTWKQAQCTLYTLSNI